MNRLTRWIGAGCLQVLLVICLSNFARAAQTREDVVKRLDRSAEVLNEIIKTPDKGIPAEVIARAKCIAVVPSLVKVAIGIGGEHGRGVATCRLANGGWSAPGFFAMTGG